MLSNLKDRKLKTMPAWKQSKLSHGSRYADSGRNGGEEYDMNGHLIKSSKMFDSQGHSKSIDEDSQNRMKTIPQSEVENSQMLGSEDFTGQGA